MRQAGLKPKSHKSGVYWTRANARNGNAAMETPVAGLPLVMFFVIAVLLPIYAVYWGITRGIYYIVCIIFLTKTKG
jgi:hypothetical protein